MGSRLDSSREFNRTFVGVLISAVDKLLQLSFLSSTRLPNFWWVLLFRSSYDSFHSNITDLVCLTFLRFVGARREYPVRISYLYFAVGSTFRPHVFYIMLRGLWYFNILTISYFCFFKLPVISRFQGHCMGPRVFLSNKPQNLCCVSMWVSECVCSFPPRV